MPKMLSLALLATLWLGAWAHLPFYETQRFRHDFIGLAGWNQPVADDDWSFEQPLDLLSMSSYINRTTGQRVFRENAGCALESLLVNSKRGTANKNLIGDQDVILYNKTTTTPVVFFGTPQVPACAMYKDFYPTLALLGPLGTRDAVTNELLFSESRSLPFTLPVGYGAKVVRHPRGHFKHRGAFLEPITSNMWMYPQGWSTACSEPSRPTFPLCDKTNLLYVTIADPAAYYWVIWSDALIQFRPLDVGLVVGTVDLFQPDDFVRLANIQDAISRGVTVHGLCTPLPTGFLVFD